MFHIMFLALLVVSVVSACPAESMNTAFLAQPTGSLPWATGDFVRIQKAPSGWMAEELGDEYPYLGLGLCLGDSFACRNRNARETLF